ncbi:MAG TPA: GYF domain-containing protein [Humisphaera sp.]
MAANDEYYYAIGDQQRGPVPVSQLPGLGVQPGTLVWRDGMAEWVRADQVPAVAAALAAAAAHNAAAAANPYGPVPGRAVDPAVTGYPTASASPPYGTAQPYAVPQDQAPAAGYGPAPAYAPPGYPPAGQTAIGYAGAPTYAAGGYGGYGGGYVPVGNPPGHGQSLASMILGISGLVTVCFYGLGFVLGVVAVVLGHIGQGTHRRATGRPNGMATAGLICGYIAIGLNVLIVAILLIVMAGAG